MMRWAKVFAVPMLLAIAGIAWFVYRYYAGR
jgi:hypothetical protein